MHLIAWASRLVENKVQYIFSFVVCSIKAIRDAEGINDLIGPNSSAYEWVVNPNLGGSAFRGQFPRANCAPAPVAA